MITKSYLSTKALDFSTLETAPAYLGELNGRFYYAFAENVQPPSGGKNVSDAELQAIKENAPLFRQIKARAQDEILKVAPLWQQVNALADLVLLGQKSNPTTEEQGKLEKSQQLLTQVKSLRNKSNEIEEGFLNGQATDYLSERVWIEDAE